MEHDHEGQRVSRRTLVRGMSLLSLGGLLAACASETESTPAGAAPRQAALLGHLRRCSPPAR